MHLFPSHPVHSPASASKQHLHTQRVPNNDRLVSCISGSFCVASLRLLVFRIPGRPPLASHPADHLRPFSRPQFRSGLTPPVLLDRLPSDAILPNPTMDGGLSRKPMDACDDHVHSSYHFPSTGKVCLDRCTRGFDVSVIF